MCKLSNLCDNIWSKGAGAFSDSKFNMDYRVGGDVHVVTGKKIVNDTIKDVVEVLENLDLMRSLLD